MKSAEVTIGGRYLAKVSGKVATVKIISQSPHGGWDARNEATGRTIRLKSARRLIATAPAVNRLEVIKSYRRGGLTYWEARDRFKREYGQ